MPDLMVNYARFRMSENAARPPPTTARLDQDAVARLLQLCLDIIVLQ